MPINRPDNFCYDIVVEPVSSLSSNNEFDSIGDITPISGTNCKTESSALLLDTYGSAAAAYSVRLLRSDYSGPCCRIRRDADNDELDIGFDVNGNFDEAALSDFVDAGTATVSIWYDQSGNSYNASAAATNQPQIYTSGTVSKENGIVALKFDGTNDYLNNPDLATVQPNTVSFVATARGQDYFYDGDDDTSRQVAYVGSGFYLAYAGSTQFSDTAYQNGLQTGQFIVYDNQDGAFFINGQGENSGVPFGARVLNGIDIGQRFSDTSQLLGTFQELIFWNSDLRESRLKIEADVNNYYSIY